MKSFKKLLITTGITAMVLSIVFWIMATPGHSYMFFGMLFSDLLPAAILMSCAIFLRNRFLGVLSVIVTFFTFFVKIGAMVLYAKSFLAVTYDTMALLLEHTDHEGCKAMIGNHYYLWTPVVGLLFLALLFYCAKITVKYFNEFKDGKVTERQNDRILTWVLSYTLLSLFCNAMFVYFHDVNTETEENYVGHVVTPFPILCSEIYTDFRREVLHRGAPIQYGFKRNERMTAEQTAYLQEIGLRTAPEEENIPPYPQFERIVVIAVESLDADFLSHSGNPKIPTDLTPNLDEMQKRHFAFSNYWSASQPTSWGLTALILGRVDYKLDKKLKSVSLCDILRENGYKSYYISPIDGEFGDNRKVFSKLFRFDQLIFEDELRRDYPYVKGAGGWGLSDESMYRATLDFLHKEKPQKYFLLLSTMDSHNPYHASGPTSKNMKYNVPFLDSIHAVDDNLGRFVRNFTSDPVLFNDKTLLIITADHSACHGLNFTTRAYLPQSAKTPLIFIANCDFQKFKFNKDRMFSTIDLAADIALFAGAKKIPDTFMGRPSVSKKDFALTRNMEDVVTLYLPNAQPVSFDKLHPVLKNNMQRALYQHYLTYYPNLE